MEHSLKNDLHAELLCLKKDIQKNRNKPEKILSSVEVSTHHMV